MQHGYGSVHPPIHMENAILRGGSLAFAKLFFCCISWFMTIRSLT
jgi:hypothetical protein